MHRLTRLPHQHLLRRTLSTTAPRPHAPLTHTVSSPTFFNAVGGAPIPAFRVLGPDGVPVEGEAQQLAEQADGDKLERVMEVMTMLPVLVRPLLLVCAQLLRKPARGGSAAAWA